MKFEILSRTRKWQLVLTLITTVLINSNVFATTITVDGTDGSVQEDGVCTLNEAIESANTDTAVDSCQAGNGVDIIEFTADITINAFYENYPTFGKTGLQVITSPIIIDGMGYKLERDENLTCNIDNNNDSSEFRLILMTDASDLTLKNMTLQNGCADGAAFEAQGGAILNISSGKLVLKNSSFISNEAFFGGGIHNYGLVGMIENTTFDSNSGIAGGAIFNDIAGINKIFGSIFINNHSSSSGGGIFNQGTIDEIINSLFTLNESGFGAGVDNRNVITTIANSTFSDNMAAFDGGGLFAQGDSSIGSIKNTTFSNNTANFGGGFYNFNNTLTEFFNNTFANNNAVFEGGGLFNRGVINNFRNSLFYNNTADTFADCRIAAGSINGSDNLSNQSSNDCGNLITPNSITTGSLGILTDNGCATPLADDSCIPSHALMFDSEAIDAADNYATSIDQRGLLANGPRDVGAFEFGATVSDLIFKDGFTDF